MVRGALVAKQTDFMTRAELDDWSDATRCVLLADYNEKLRAAVADFHDTVHWHSSPSASPSSNAGY